MSRHAVRVVLFLLMGMVWITLCLMVGKNSLE
ncbi:hypothetical protein ATCC53582_01066 [Novacetimonas hansenii]|nr:hypothetical protein ATCC53582_01066 [Novacetimonas hansenii]